MNIYTVSMKCIVRIFELLLRSLCSSLLVPRAAHISEGITGFTFLSRGINIILVIVLFQINTPLSAYSADKMVIVAPSEKARVNNKWQFDIQRQYTPPNVPMYTKGWVCEEDGSKAYVKTVDYISKLKNIEEALLITKNRLEKSYLDIKNTIKPPATFAGFSRKTVVDHLEIALKGYPKSFKGYLAELNNLKEELKSVTEEPEKFFSVNFDEKEVRPFLAMYENDGQSRVYTLSDCFSREEIKQMQSIIEKTLKSCIGARDELQKTINSVYDGKDMPIDLTKF